MMLNDVIFCLDDAILKLQEIRSTETIMADPAQVCVFSLYVYGCFRVFDLLTCVSLRVDIDVFG